MERHENETEFIEKTEEEKLLSILNICRLQAQFYRPEDKQVQELLALIYAIGKEDPYFVAQCIVWSRCCGEGMRTINHLAAAALAPYISGLDWAKRFYSRFDKKTADTEHPTGGCIFRLDDMLEIKNMHKALFGKPLSNAMKKGFANVLETSGNYDLLKYKKTVIDISNLTHPDSKKSQAEVLGGFGTMKTLDAIMSDAPVHAETWETQNSQAGQEIAEKVKSGEISEDEAKTQLKEALSENWNNLLSENKLGILAALRNIRNILKDNPSEDTISKLCNLVSNSTLIKQGKIMPYQLELAVSIVDECSSKYSSHIRNALKIGMVEALPNFRELLPGKTCVMVDCSGSMTEEVSGPYAGCRKSCMDKASILAAMLTVGTGADVVVFGSRATWFKYSPFDSIFDISDNIKHLRMGGTNISKAFDLIKDSEKCYDRIFLLSDNEANAGCLRSSYKAYKKICDPYVYCIDLAGYGRVPLTDGRVHYFNGYGYSMLDQIASYEFNASKHFDQVKNVVI